VAQQHAGVASGINNAVSRVAGLLAVAIFGAVLYAAFSRTLDREMPAMNLPAAVSQQINEQRRDLAAAHTSDPRGREAVQRAFIAGYRTVVWIGVALAVASAISAAVMIGDEPSRTS